MRPALAAALLLLAGCATDLPPDARWPDRSEPIGGTGPLGYVTNNGDDTVSVIELSPLREVARRPVGRVPVDLEAPHHLALDPVAGFVWVGLSDVGLVAGGGLHGSHGGGVLPSYVQRLRMDDLAVDGEEVRVDPNLGDILRGPNDRIFTTHFDLATALDVASRGAPVEQGYGALYVIDGTTMEVISHVSACTSPHGAAITRDGTRAVLACYGDDGIAVIDLTTTPPTVLSRVPVGPGPGTVSTLRYGPYAVALSPDESFALVSVLDGQSVRRIDMATLTEDSARAVVMDGRAFFGSFDATGARFWVATQARDSITRIDVATGMVAARHGFTAAECLSPHEAVYREAIDRVLVVCEGDHQAPSVIVAVDPETLEVVDRLDVGVYPDVLRVAELP